MLKRFLIAVWLLAAVGLMAYHYGPGQARLALDDAARKVAAAKECEAKEDWQGAFEAWGAALAATPKEDVAVRLELRLAQARTRMYTGELPEAMMDLEALLTEAERGPAGKPLVKEVRGTLAGAQYYAAWLMRLEGAATEEWLIPAEGARQHFRLLAEQAETPAQGDGYKKNLEAAIRLTQMDLSELQGMPLPKSCSGCKNVSQKCRSQSQSQCKSQGEPKEKKDARGAGFNEIPKGGS
jgi:hypothetical protein